MAEAEDVLTDAARHATIFARDLWLRHRPQKGPACVHLRDVQERLGLLVGALFDIQVPLRFAQPPVPPTLLTRLFRHDERPRPQTSLPATDGASIWLPAQISNSDTLAPVRYRCMALLQAVRIKRGSAEYLEEAIRERVQDIYQLLEARSAHVELVRLLPGLRQDLDAFRKHALESRPPLDAFASQRRPFEQFVRAVMRGETVLLSQGLDASSPANS